MQIFIAGQSTRVVDVESTTTIKTVKDQIVTLEGIPCEEQQITFCGTPLEDDSTFESMPELSTLFVTGKLLGGKVHGSLARAGKVKGQTPKVEAGEKKKKKTGRCKRRIQYNRRFSTAVSAFGRKKGPNSNSD